MGKETNGELTVSTPVVNGIVFGGDTPPTQKEAYEACMSKAVTAQKKGEIADETMNFLNSNSRTTDKDIEHLREFFKNNTMRIPTGIDFFDEAANGGIYRGLSIICAPPSAGKTTLLVQIASALSYKGVPVVFITRDMSAEEIMLKFLSHVSSQYHCESQLDIGTITNLLETGNPIPSDVVNAYKKVCGNVHIRELREGKEIEFYKFLNDLAEDSVTDEREVLGILFDIYTKMYEKKPVFIIDSLQTVAIALSEGYTSKEEIDRALTLIKGYQMKYQVPVIMVSNLNRNGYDKPLDLVHLKESGNIEYECSSIFGLDVIEKADGSFNLDGFRNKPIRELMLKNLKDRCGICKTVSVEFDAVHSVFRSAEILSAETDSMAGMSAKSDMQKLKSAERKKAKTSSEDDFEIVDANELLK